MQQQDVTYAERGPRGHEAPRSHRTHRRPQKPARAQADQTYTNIQICYISLLDVLQTSATFKGGRRRTYHRNKQQHTPLLRLHREHSTKTESIG